MLLKSLIGLALVLGVTNLVINHTYTTPVVQEVVVPQVSSSTMNTPISTLTNKLVVKKSIETVRPSNPRTVKIIGEIGPESTFIAEEIKSLGSSSKEPLYVLINSPGGSVLDGALIVSAIQSSQSPVYTVCLQLCASMAAIIHQYGTERLMTDRSIVMFHPAAAGLQGSLPQMSSRLSVLNSYVDKMDAYVAQRAGLSLPDFLVKINNELWLDAEDATAQHLNDKIVNVLLPKATLGGDIGSNNAKNKIDLRWE